MWLKQPKLVAFGCWRLAGGRNAYDGCVAAWLGEAERSERATSGSARVAASAEDSAAGWLLGGSLAKESHISMAIVCQ
jgi:hypothetical protein